MKVRTRLVKPADRAAPGPSWQDERASAGLRKLLMAGDAITISVGFAVPLIALADRRPDTIRSTVSTVALVTAAGLWSMRLQGLYAERVTALRAVEASKLSRALVIVGAVVLLLDRKLTMDVRGFDVAAAASIAWVVVVVWRSAYRGYVANERRRRRILKRMVMVGTGRRAASLYRLLGVHPELGLVVTAVIGDHHGAQANGLGQLWRGDYDDAPAVLNSIDAEVVLLCSTGIEPSLEVSLTRDAHSRGRTVYVDPGVSSFDVRRIQALHLAHQPLLEVESPSLATLQHVSKRGFDIAVASLLSLLALPLMAVAALVVWVDDRGPVLFRQTRVGRHGKRFQILKFRTMVVNAEARLAEVASTNERQGPLFKMDRDPRVTRVGRFLRATSLDELPQLFNVIVGTMSLVGPRPALPAEVADFPAELNARHDVRPGITGLWQVEARDNPSFEVYRRLDLFYVDNWSLTLDLVILLATADDFLLRPLLRLWDRRRTSDDDDAVGDLRAA